MERRKLEGKELELTHKALDKAKEELEMWESQKNIEHVELELLPDKFKLLKYNKERTLVDLKNQIYMAKQKVDIYSDQIDNGVEPKEKQK